MKKNIQKFLAICSFLFIFTWYFGLYNQAFAANCSTVLGRGDEYELCLCSTEGKSFPSCAKCEDNASDIYYSSACGKYRLGWYKISFADFLVKINPDDFLVRISQVITFILSIYFAFKIIFLYITIDKKKEAGEQISDYLKYFALYILMFVVSLSAVSISLFFPRFLGLKVPTNLIDCSTLQVDTQAYKDCIEITGQTPTPASKDQLCLDKEDDCRGF